MVEDDVLVVDVVIDVDIIRVVVVDSIVLLSTGCLGAILVTLKYRDV